MLRITVLVLALLLTARPASAQLGMADLKDEVGRLDIRHHAGYERAVTGREFLASLHDSIKHPAYDEMKAARDKYVAIRTEISQAVAANDPGKGSKRVADLAAAGEVLTDKVQAYINSSSNAVEKIQIGLGVFAFLICGVGYLIFRRRKKKI